MPTRDVLRKAQAAATTYLEMRGYEIIEQNWRQSRHKVDIIAKKNELIYFVNVHYTSSDNLTNPVETVTAGKIKQMHQAALAWAVEYKWLGNYRLSTIDIDGPSFAVLSFLDQDF